MLIILTASLIIQAKKANYALCVLESVLYMVWLNDHKEITHIESGVNPATFPETFCASNARYVLEINSGKASELNLSTGQKLQF